LIIINLLIINYLCLIMNYEVESTIIRLVTFG
jgi:hypothetical protein